MTPAISSLTLLPRAILLGPQSPAPTTKREHVNTQLHGPRSVRAPCAPGGSVGDPQALAHTNVPRLTRTAARPGTSRKLTGLACSPFTDAGARQESLVPKTKDSSPVHCQQHEQEGLGPRGAPPPRLPGGHHPRPTGCSLPLPQ